MKKLLLFAGLAAATLSFVGCNKQESDFAGNEGQFAIRFVTPETKTVNDGMSTKWAEGDALTVFYAKAGTTAYSENNKFEFSDPDSGVANADISLSSGAYDWYAFYPYNSYFASPANNNDNPARTYIGRDSRYAQTQEGYGSKTHLAGTGVPVYGVTKGVSSSNAVEIQMKHIAAVAEIVVTNKSGKAVTITGVDLSAPEDVDIVGQYNISFDAEPVITKYNNYQSNTAKLTVSDGTALADGASAKFYLVVKPFKAKSLTVKVTTDSGSNEKTATLSSEASFQAGHIKTLNFSYEKPAELETLTVADLVEAAEASQSFSGNFAGATVTFVSGKNAFMQDDKNGVLVYMDNHGLNAGDFVSGTISGAGSPYRNLPEITSFSYSSAVSGTVPAPIELTLSQLLANFDSYISRYVKLTGVTASSAFSSRNANLADGDDSIVLRDQKNGLTIEANGTYDIIGFPTIYNETKQMGVWLQDHIIQTGSGSGGGDEEEKEGKITVPRTIVSMYVDDVYDLGATTNSTATMTFVSADPSIASVSSEGVVTGESEGTTTITITLPAVPGSFTGDEKEINVTVNPKSGDAGGTWVATSVSSIKDGAEFVLVASVNGNYYAMSNDGKGSSGQPLAISVQVSGNKLAEVPTNTIWVFEKSGSNYIFHSPAGDKDTWLYCTANNNGLRTGTSDTKLLYMDSNNYLTVEDTKGEARNIGVYTGNSDWRSYKVQDGGVANNIKDQTFTFYVKQ